MGSGEGLGLRFDIAFEVAIAFLLYGFLLFALFGPSTITKVANHFMGLYWPDDSKFRVVPEYSIAEARVKQGRYAEAIDEYRKVIEQFPDDVYAHVRVAELFVERFNDPKSAEIELLAAVEKAKVEDAFAFGAQRLADLYQYSLQEPRRAYET